MGRRGKNEGSIFRRKDGLWGASLDLGYINGKRKRKTVYARTRKEAAEKLQELRKQIDQGVNLATQRQSVGEFLSYWLENHVQGALAPKTAARYEQTIRLHLTPAIGHILLPRLSSQHVQTLVTDLRQTYTARTTRLHHSILHAALERAVHLGLLSRNPADHIDLPRIDESPARAITREHEAQIFTQAEAEGHRLTPLFQLAIKTGLRREEILALAWADIDLEKAELRVRKGKTPRSRRTLSISSDIVAILQKHWTFQQQERWLQGTDWKEHGLVFPTALGTPINPSSLWHMWDSLQRRAGIPEPHYRFHDLRHTCATRMAEANVHPRVAMEILGHNNIAVTMEIYTHVSSDSQRDAFEKMDRLSS